MPSLPSELERLIFEMAVLQNIDHDSSRLILVAKRVYEWIRPILYRVAVVDEQPIWRTPRGAAIAPFARHLLVTSHSAHTTYQDVIEILSAFRNVENFAIWHSGSIDLRVLEKLNDLPLRMLSVGLEQTGLSKAIEHCPAFMNITHLEIIALQGDTWNDCKTLVDLPKLTHISLDPQDKVEVEDEVILYLLEHCPSLRTMIYQPIYKCTIEADDLRFLILEDEKRRVDFIAEWRMSANGGIGLWELADIIIGARKEQLFGDNCSFAFSRRTWMDKLNEGGRRWYKEWSRGFNK